MIKTTVAIIGAGQAGLATSSILSAMGIDHTVFERERAGARWRADGPGRLLTPNWMTRLPGLRSPASDPHGFMKFGEVAQMLSRYARDIAAPMHEAVEVEAAFRHGCGWRLETSSGPVLARAMVVATGHCQRPFIPGLSDDVASSIAQFAARDYRGPASLPPGGVLVVGASASGAQIAEELALAGRQVVLSVGNHTRLPRRYRGRDIMEWLDHCGILDELTIASPRVARPSLQLAGRTDGSSPDLATLSGMGVRLAGRAVAARQDAIFFAGDLPAHCAAAHRRMERTLDRIDAFVDAARGDRPAAFLPQFGPDRIDLAGCGIASIVWATGYSRAYGWLRAPALDAGGELLHEGGVSPLPGLYAIGLNFMRRRKSGFIDGVGDDARDICRHLAASLGVRSRDAA